MHLNNPKYSKINWTAGTAFAVSLLVGFGIVPEEHREVALQVIATVPPVAVWVFRTWFTGNKGE